ncbi:MAG: hypothetical protein IJH63_00375 [Methanobrevibacter sp.]|nr:hypothetical protein [Methanosphaera sp.]MBR0369158.1 hypothetical protein [Methanobrevibacter sp.]
MASNEDILMQFTAQDDISSVAEEIEANVSSAFLSATSAVEELDMGLSNLVSSADAVSSAFGEMESSIDSAESSADSFQSTIGNIDGGNLSEVTSSATEASEALSSAEEEASNLAGQLLDLDGTTVDISIESSGLDVDTDLNVDSTNGQDTSALRTSMYDDMVNLSGSIKDVGDSAVEAASTAEQGWLRFGNAVNNTGGNWEAQEESIKSWVKTYSNNLGRGVADTRTAMTTFLNMGMSLDETQKTMEAVSNYAAQFGISQAEASKMIQMSFMGAGRSIKKLGLDIADFKDAAGNVDREKLLAAIMEKTSGAAEKYADTYEARVQKMNNAINSLRTDFGREIINTIEPLIPVVQQAFQAFSSLPQPIKSTVLAFAGLAGGAAIVAGPLIKMRAYMNMAGLEMGTLRKSIGLLQTGYKALAGGEGISGAISAMKNFSKPTEKVVEEAAKVGALAPEASAAAGGATATGGALSGIASAFTSMIVPLLAIAAVVAVMIPIIAGLAAEALIFIKGIQLLIDALDFDKIDLTSAIEGIKQVGSALLEMGIAMAEMTFANVMTGLAVLTSGLTGLVNPVQVAGALLINAAKELEVFNNVNIDSNVPKNIKKISESLKLVSEAMNSLTTVVVDMAVGNLATLGGLLGNVSDAITTAKNEITNAAKEIETLKDLPDIDEGAVNKLKKVSSGLDSVATAMEALRSLRDGQNWDNLFSGLTNLFGGINIGQALSSVRQDIYDASVALKQFTGVSDIPEDVAGKLKKVASTLKSVSESVETLRKLRDDYNWDSTWGNIFQGTDIPGAINSIKNDLFKVAASLRSLNGISAIPEGLGNKIQRVTWTVNNVKGSVSALNGVPQVSEGASDRVTKAVTTVSNVARQLNRLGNINVSGGIGESLRQVREAITSLRTTLNKASGGFRTGGVNIGRNIRSGISAGLNNLSGVVRSRVSSATSSGAGVARSGGARMGSSGTSGFQSNFKLAQVVSSEMTYSVQAVQNGTAPFVEAVRQMAKEAVEAAKNELEQQSPGKIARMWGAEMGFSSDLVYSRGQGLISAMRDITGRVVAVGNGNLNPAWDSFNFDYNRLNTINNMRGSSDLGKTQRPVNIIVGEGAVQLDARNLTTEESRQIMVNAMEGIDDIEYIEVNKNI